MDHFFLHTDSSVCVLMKSIIVYTDDVILKDPKNRPFIETRRFGSLLRKNSQIEIVNARMQSSIASISPF